jgi:hypothetical protein
MMGIFRQFVLFAVFMLVSGGVAWADPAIFLGQAASPPERAAALELQRLVFAGNRELWPVREIPALEPGDTGIVLGTAHTLPDGTGLPADRELPRQDGYLLETRGRDNELVVVTAADPAGVRNGVYGLLTRLGYGFYANGTVAPPALPDIGQFPVLDERHEPLFETRGALLRYGYLASASTWEREDYYQHINNLARMRINLVGFLASDTEPFGAWESDGQWVGGEPLPNTARYAAGTGTLTTPDYLGGTGLWFASDHFGAAASFIEDREVAIAEARAVLRDAMAYARGEGMAVALGIEVSGDALDPARQAAFEAQVRSLLDAYPAIDYLWLWEPGSQRVALAQGAAHRSPWDSHIRRWDDAFQGITRPGRKAEAVRMSLYALQARQLLAALRPGVRVLLGGRGGDESLRMTDAMPGMDRILPADIGFAFLDNKRITPDVSDAYLGLSPERPAWPVLSLELDGDLWMPQPNLREVAGACEDALAKGADGIVGALWRAESTSDALSFMARRAWEPGLTPESYCEDRARHVLGNDLGPALAPILADLDALGYRWVGGTGQNERFPFVWTPGEGAKSARLARIAARLRSELGRRGLLGLLADLPKALPEIPLAGDLTFGLLDRQSDPADSSALIGLISEIDFVLAYDRAARLFAEGGELDNLLEDGYRDEALKLVAISGFPEAVQLYSHGIQSKSELATLASINTRAWQDLRERIEITPEEAADLTMPEKEGKPRILVLSDRVIAVGLDMKRTRLELRVRAAGERRYRSHPLRHLGNAVYALDLPGEAEGAPAYEYGVVARRGFGTAAAWPPGFPKVSAVRHVKTPPELPDPEPPAGAAPAAPALTADIIANENRVRLTWDARPGEWYTVLRGQTPLATVPGGWCEDTAPPSGMPVNYTVTARDLASGHEASASIHMQLPELPLPQPPGNVLASTRSGRVVLGWMCDDPAATAYEVTRFGSGDTIVETTRTDAAPGQFIEFSEPVREGDTVRGAVIYAVAAIAPDGRVGPVSERVGVFPSSAPLRPVVHLALDSEDILTELAWLTNNGVTLGGVSLGDVSPAGRGLSASEHAGRTHLGRQSAWDPASELTIALWFKLDDLNGLPVLVSKGPWQQPAYYLQVFHGVMRFYLAGAGMLDAGAPGAGTWRHVVVTYGSGTMRLYLDGRLAGQRRTGPQTLSAHQPDIRSGFNEDAFTVRGIIDDLRVFDAVLTPQEVESLHAETQRP